MKRALIDSWHVGSSGGFLCVLLGSREVRRCLLALGGPGGGGRDAHSGGSANVLALIPKPQLGHLRSG